MKMRDREEFGKRFDNAAKYADRLVEATTKDISQDRKVDPVEIKVAISGMLAQALNVESLLAVSAELAFRLAEKSAPTRPSWLAGDGTEQP